MFKKYLVAGSLGTLALAWAVFAQSPLQTAVTNSMKAMGADNVKTLTLMGEGGDGALGQQLDPHSDFWRWYANKNFVRGYDFDAKGFRTQRIRGEGNVPPGGGNGTTTPAPDQTQNTVTMATAFPAQIEMAMTPIGFLKLALEKGATVENKTDKGKKWTVLSFPMNVDAVGTTPAYKTMLYGYIDDKGMVQKVETKIDQGFLGDIMWTAEFSDWKDFSGLKFPTHIVQRQGGPKYFELKVSDVKVNQPVDLAAAAKGGPGGAKGGVPGAAPGGAAAKGGPAAAKGGPGAAKGGAAPAAADATEDLGGGFWLVKGGYAAIICDFKDYVMILEGPSNDARTDQILAEAKRLAPNKPIKYVVNTHYHFDHSGGLRAMAAQGITVVTYKGNKGLYEKALTNPHTLVPDEVQKSGKPLTKVKLQYIGDTKVFTDGTHTVETHHIEGSSHDINGLLFYLPKQKIVMEADEFNVLNPTPTAPITNPNSYQVNLAHEMERLKLDVDRIIPVHLPNDNHKVTLQELKYSAGKQ